MSQFGILARLDGTLEHFIPGVTDFSVENWFHPRTDEEAAAYTYWPIEWNDEVGLSAAAGAPARVIVDNTGWSINLDDLVYSDLGTAGPAGPPIQARWYHVVLNMDRDGYASVWANGELVLQHDISADAAVNIPRFCCLPGNTWDGATHIPTWSGPLAAHQRLLTTAEIRESWRQGSVQALSESAFSIHPKHSVQLGGKDWTVDSVIEAAHDLYLGNAAAGGTSAGSYKAATPSDALGLGFWYGTFFRDLSPNGNHIVALTAAGAADVDERFTNHVDSRKVT